MEDNLIKKDIQDVFSTAFLNYAGYNIQRRAIPDARDGLKWGARQLLHAQMLGGFTYDKPFKKAIKSVSQAMGFCYVHGDSSAYGTLIRMAKPFSYRVPLQEAKGNYGTLINPSDHSAARYVELRGSAVAAQVLKDLKKDTIIEWEDTYDLEGQFPKVLPSKGIWLGVNGCISIGSGMACSIPPTNLKEVNEALIKLLWNPQINFEEIYCTPDFPTGAILLNENEVKESLKNGYGHACKIRAVVEYDNINRCFIVKEMPYSTFTNTICNELATLMESNPKCGVKNFVDYTGEKPDLRIYLNKNANPDKVLSLLYKETSLQTFFSINMVMLDNGISPKTFGWKEALQAHLDHEFIVYRRGFEFDVNKINNRLHILDGIFICLENIETIIQIIKQSTSTTNAAKTLQEKYNLDDVQTTAILNMKLSRLAHLEVQKLEKEHKDLSLEKDRLTKILTNEDLLKKEIENGLKEVAKNFGDSRRTQVLNIEGEEEDVIEQKNIQICLTNQNNLLVTETSSLYTQRRGGVGVKFKLNKDEYIVSTTSGMNTDILMLFSKKGNVFNISISQLTIGEKIPVESLINTNEQIKTLEMVSKENQNRYVIFVTKKGLIKKSYLSDCITKRKSGLKIIELNPEDEIKSILTLNNENIGIMSQNGHFIIVGTKDITPLGRIARGRKGMSLNNGDFVQGARIISDNTQRILSISKDGYVKTTKINEFNITGLNTKGQKIQKLKDNGDLMIDFLPINDETQLIIISNNTQIKINLSDVPTTSRSTIGTKSMQIRDNNKVVGISSMTENLTR